MSESSPKETRDARVSASSPAESRVSGSSPTEEENRYASVSTSRPAETRVSESSPSEEKLNNSRRRNRGTSCAGDVIEEEETHEPEIKLGKVYVDDSRLLAETMPIGTRYDRKTKSFIWTSPEECEDTVRNSQTQALAALNDQVEGLNFTMEDIEDFPERHLPTLDFSLEISDTGVLDYI